MSGAELLALTRSDDLDGFELACLELLESGNVPVADLVAPFEHLFAAGAAERALPLGQMVIEAVLQSELANDSSAWPATLALVRLVLNADPGDANLRKIALDLYQRVHGQQPGFAAVLEASGLAGTGPARIALKVLELGLTLGPGATLISRSDGRAVEVTHVDGVRALFTLRREGRTTTLPLAEVAREYDPVDPDDFRVLRQLRPDRLQALIESDPMALVIGLIHAHGTHIDADRLKHELVPRYIPAQDWTKWWNRAREELKRSPHVIVSGRAPVTLSFCREGRTLEQEVRAEFDAQNDPLKWLRVAAGYLREKAGRKEKPDPELVTHFHTQIRAAADAARARRPGEALACALVLARLADQGVPVTQESRELAVAILRAADDPARLIVSLEHELLWEHALEVLPAAFPDDGAKRMTALMPLAPAGALDRIAAAALDAGLVEEIQRQIDAALADPVQFPELLYWLWKGAARKAKFRPPSADTLLATILDTLDALGRTLNPGAEVARAFRLRMRSALSLRDYAQVRACFARADEARATTLHLQLRRVEGLGKNVPAAMRDTLREFHPALWELTKTRLEPWEDPDVLWTTSEGLRKRVAARDEIVNVKMRENAKRIGEAAAHGDLSENSEYRFALEERDLLRARVAQINAELSIARTLQPHEVPTERVGVGSRVTLRGTRDGTERVMTFLGPFETDVDGGVYNYRAPLSHKLMGLRVGARVTLTIDGREMEFQIVAIVSSLP